MKTRGHVRTLAAVAGFVLLLLSCTLPGMIPLTPLPKMETNTDAVIEVLNGTDWHFLQSLAEEQYSEEDYARPGTLTFTVTIPDEKPTYFVYGWCTSDEQTLRQNFEHIVVKLYLNGDELTGSKVHNLSYTLTDGKTCLDYGILFSEWPPGKYELKAVATFDQKINDGFADYDAGDYVFEYNVTVEKK